MGYQAVLFCPDEKLARLISQVFHEVDFVVDHVTEPFAAVKKLMAQHYDAIVVDCDNDQNSALLFRSARNSSFNQSSLAIAVVEGQAGVAKAYRIGANLVLTKPINVEQSKGTLRVARGLLKKSADSGTAAGPDSSTAKTAAPTARVESPAHSAAVVVPAIPGEIPQTPATLPVTSSAGIYPPAPAASAKTEEKPPTIPEPVVQGGSSAFSEPANKPTAPPAAGATGLTAKKVESPSPSSVATEPPIAPSASPSAAAAPAPAKESIQPAERAAKPKEEVLDKQEALAEAGPVRPQATPSFATDLSDGPSFAALGQEEADGGGKKKILIAAVVVVALAAAGYFGSTIFSHPNSSATPRTAAPAPQRQSAPAPESAPMPSPASSPAPVNRPSASLPSPSRTTVSEPNPPAKSGSPDRSAAQSTSDATESQVAPIVVKPATRAQKPQTPSEDVAEQFPSPLGVASPNEGALSGVMSPDANASKPTLARIKISQGVSQGLLIKSVPPKYPRAALASHLQGEVQIEATISKEGNVLNPKVLKGDRILADAALEAVRQWRYKPYYLDGQPVDIQTQITIKFKGE